MSLFRQSAVAARGALTRPDGKAVFAASAVAYLLLYTAGLRNLGFGSWGYELSVVSDPWPARSSRSVPSSGSRSRSWSSGRSNCWSHR
ncbi:hypothetical protein [Haloarcula pelagica]|uniref:hypothetical protein n=1 Tax=Halomicroarcula sp. GCM10025709 TaxID=3252669 RepID=UPI0036D387BD